MRRLKHSANQTDEEAGHVGRTQNILNGLQTLTSSSIRTNVHLFPTLADLPGLLMAPVFEETQVRHFQHQHEHKHSSEEIVREVIEELLSKVLQTVEEKAASSSGDGKESPKISEEPSAYMIPLTDSENIAWLIDNLSVDVNENAPELESVLSEHQVITTELNEFITMHQENWRKSGCNKLDKILDEEEDNILTDNSRGVCISLFLISLVVVGNLIGAILVLNKAYNSEHPYTCRTPNCIRMSQWLKKAMDPSVNPCDDFYQFACGSYIEKHPPLKKVPDGEPIYLHREGIPVDFSQNEKIGKFLKKVSSFPENQILPFYQACIDTKRRDVQGIKPLVHLFAQVRILSHQSGPFSSNSRFNVARVMGRIFRKTNRLFFVDFDGVVDNVIVFKLSKPATDVLMTPPEQYVETMRKAWRLLAKDLYVDGEEEIETIVYLVMKFEAELSIIRTKGAESSVFGFPANFNNHVPKPAVFHSNFVRLRGYFEWDDLLAAMFDYSEGNYEEYQVFFNLWSSFYSKEDRFFLMYLQDTLKNTPAYTIFRYMQWELIKAFAFDLSKEMQDIMLYIYPSSGSTLIARCFRSVFSNLHVLAGHRFKMLIENPDAIDRNMTKLSDKIFDTYVNAIQQLELPEALKASLLATSKTLKVVIEPLSGLRSHLKVFYDSLNSTNDHFINVIQARSIKARNAVIKVKRKPPFHKWLDGEYSLTEITQTSFADSWSTIRYMHIPFAAMQEPYMDNNLPILDYAGFGQYVVSVFLVQNALEDLFQLYATFSQIFEPRAEVKLVKGLQNALFERVDCVVRSFANISLRNHPQLKLNTQIPTIRMNMLANTFAVELTMLVIDTIYNSTTSLTEAEKNSPIYELQHAKEKLTEKFPKFQILPGLEKYSPRQLAFLSIARQNCQTFSKDRVEHRMNHGPLLREIRIKGSFRNSPAFAQAWNCPKKSFMNPKKKCVILLGEKVKYGDHSQEVESSDYDAGFDEDHDHNHNHDDR